MRWRSVSMAWAALACFATCGARAQVHLPEGFEVVELGEHDRPSFPRMNNCGEIVYSSGAGPTNRINRYDNGRTVALSDPEPGFYDVLPDINDAGTVAWVHGVFNEYATPRVVVLENGERTVVRRAGPPAINASGEIATQRFRGYTCGEELNYDSILYTNGRVIRFSKDEFWDQAHRINDQCDVVWMHANFCVDPWAGNILLYSEGRVTTLPSRYTQLQAPDINNRGDVVWDAGPVVELYRDGETVPLVEFGSVPAINNHGDVYVAVWDFDRGTWAPWLYRESEGNPTWFRLADDPTSASRGDVNDWGEVAWRFRNEDGLNDFRLMRRVRSGDAQFDGAIDLADWSIFAGALTGPVWTNRLCETRFLDLDHDGDVDLADYARFQNAFGREE